jgi:hypothetical protein
LDHYEYLQNNPLKHCALSVDKEMDVFNKLVSRRENAIDVLQGSVIQFFGRDRFFSGTIEEVEECQDWMTECHLRAGESHYFPYFFPHIGLIAMHSALGTRGFPFLKRASVKTSFCIGNQT